MKTQLITLGFIFAFLGSYSQIQVNGYANVTSISNRTIECNHLDETWDSFEPGEIVMFYQVQDNVIGSTSNNSNFGNLGNIKSAGLIEFAKIESVSKSSSSMTIELEDFLLESFHSGSKSRLQIITYPTFIDYTTNSDIIAKKWDGYTGGVIAFNVDGELTINHNISADGAGFRGGNVSANKTGSCTGSVYSSNKNEYGGKGEGIYHSTNSSYKYGKGKILNGGGGGNHHNAGGAGGGNFSDGGMGGPGWNCNSNTGGQAGMDLSAYIINDENRSFFGGGGGGSQQNNSNGSNGANGGGLIFIKSTETTVTTGNPSISSNGNTALNGGQDGAGGAGAGGAVLIITETYNITPSASLNIEANGGAGGNVTHNDRHGSGGGGGVGSAKFFKANPDDFSGINVFTSPGDAGKRSSNSAPYSSGYGENADGKLYYDSFGGNLGNLLPVELLNQTITCNNNLTTINWATASETNNDYFMIESSEDMIDWEFVDIIPGAGNSQHIINYSFTNKKNQNSYYRLSQTDFNGDREYFDILHANCSNTDNHILVDYTQTDKSLKITVTNSADTKINYQLIDIKGNTAFKGSEENNVVQSFEIPTHNINAGIYILQIHNTKNQVSTKIFIQ